MSEKVSDKLAALKIHDKSKDDEIVNFSNTVVWVSDPEQVWIQGLVIEEDRDSVTVQSRLIKKPGNLVKVLKKDVLPMNPSPADDMTALHYLHEPGILQNLQDRYAKDAIYTYMGAAMIAVNPYKKIPEPKMNDYMTAKGNVMPHPFTISENSFKNLNVLKRNQSIIISGESGAGKTETAKIVIKFLAERNRINVSAGGNPSASKGSAAGGYELYEKLMQMSPILESFGNAKTSRNSNSSRFGKFMKLIYDDAPSSAAASKSKTLDLIGGCIETYLLEKSRVVFHSEDEQNFHIFYALLEAMPPVANLDPKYNFRIAKKAATNGGLLDPSHSLASVEEAFKTLGVTSQQISGIWKILSALLYLGNIVFEDQDTPEGRVAKVSAIPESSNPTLSSLNCLKYASDLLAVDMNSLKALMLQREVETRGEKFRVLLTVREANFARDAIIKAIYESLFLYIVKLVNKSILNLNRSSSSLIATEDNTNEKFIGVLDIFGFESFEKNGFEQLLINYANEALQNTFNKQIFEKEIALFEEERIEINIGECPSNKECVDLIGSKGESIFNTLDSISRQPQPSDERFCEELHKAFTKKSKYFGNVHRKDMKNLFVVQHYASSVKYTVGDAPSPSSAHASVRFVEAADAAPSNDNAWITKNNDAIPDGLETIYATSRLAEFMALGPIVESSGNKQEVKRRRSVMMKPTIVATFTKSMHELNEILDATTCHFIRCIKPNPRAKPNEFNLLYVVEQIRALGILQACEILSVSLPTRIPYEELKHALSSSVNKIITRFPMLDSVDGDVLLIAAIMKAYQVPEDSYRLGVTIAFFRPGQLAYLERILNSNHDQQTENMILKNIETVITQYLTIIKDISSISEQVRMVAEFVSELDERQSRLRSTVASLPVNQGLDLPEDIAKSLGEIESKYTSSQSKKKEMSKAEAKLDSLVSIKSLVRGKSPKGDAMLDRIDRFRIEHHEFDSKYEILSEKYDKIHKIIEELEETKVKTADAHLQDQVNENDRIYEKLMDLLVSVENLIKEVKLDAQRCKIDSAYEKYSAINSEINEINQQTQVLSAGIDKANEAYAIVEESLSHISYDDLIFQIETILDHFEMIVADSTKLSSVYQSLSDDLHHLDLSEPVKPAAPSAETAKPDPPAEGSKKSYNIKDLAAMKKRASVATGSSTTSSVTTDEKAASSISTELPPDWKEVFDPNTQKYFYVNRVTKQKQWKRPTITASTSPTNIPSAAAASTDDAASVKSGTSDTAKVQKPARTAPPPPPKPKDGPPGPLPPGWREILDKKTNRPYYYNEETKARQWRRPESLPSSPNAPAPDKIETVDRVSRRISLKKTSLLAAEIKAAETEMKSQAKTVNLAEEKIARAKRASALIISEELTPNEKVSEDMKQTVSYLLRIGYQIKVGSLSKQSKLLGRWRKRLFVLSEQTLFYFDSEKEYQQALKANKNNPNVALKAEKQFTITSKTHVSYTTTENCFSIANPAAEGNNNNAEDTWYLLADNETEMEDWMKALNGHVHVQYINEHRLHGKDYWDEGKVELSLWKVPTPNAANTARRPVGIRSVPDVDGPRTGEGLFPGDIIEVIQTVPSKDTDQKYLRLVDDRGWVFENHPVANYAILVPVGGKLTEKLHTYEYSQEFLEPLFIYSNPKCTKDSLTDYSLPPGSKFQTCAEWTISSNTLAEQLHGATVDEEEEEVLFCYLKLRDNRGWVEMYHDVTGGKLLKLID